MSRFGAALLLFSVGLLELEATRTVITNEELTLDLDGEEEEDEEVHLDVSSSSASARYAKKAEEEEEEEEVHLDVSNSSASARYAKKAEEEEEEVHVDVSNSSAVLDVRLEPNPSRVISSGVQNHDLAAYGTKHESSMLQNKTTASKRLVDSHLPPGSNNTLSPDYDDEDESFWKHSTFYSCVVMSFIGACVCTAFFVFGTNDEKAKTKDVSERPRSGRSLGAPPPVEWSWDQTLDTVTITTKVPTQDKRSIDVFIERARLRVGWEGNPIVIDRVLHAKIDRMGSTWNVDSEGVLKITLLKRVEEEWPRLGAVVPAMRKIDEDEEDLSR